MASNNSVKRGTIISAVLFALLLAGAAFGEVGTPHNNPCVDPTATLQSIALNASTTSAVQIIALTSGQKIYVCAITLQGGGTTPTFSLVYGTGTNCATGQTVLVTALGDLTANGVITFMHPVGVVASGNALCTLLTGTSPTAKGVLSYIQQ